jgi:hypothetical protein
MTTGVFYLSVCVFSLCVAWIVWEYGFKTLFLDAFRERAFELRVDLFSMAEKGRISYDDEAYRAIELILNGSIRYAHRLTFLSYISSVRENARAKQEDKDQTDFSQQLALKISRLKPETQKELKEILGKFHTALSLYMAASSAIFKVLFLIYLVARVFRPEEAKQQVEQRVFVMEHEVYRSARSKHGSMSSAATF